MLHIRGQISSSTKENGASCDQKAEISLDEVKQETTPNARWSKEKLKEIQIE